MMMSDAREDGTSINGEYGISTSNEKQSGEAADRRRDAARRSLGAIGSPSALYSGESVFPFSQIIHAARA